MNDLSAIVDEIRSELEVLSDARDKAIRRSRELIRYCANSIRAMHRGEFDLAQELLETAGTGKTEVMETEIVTAAGEIEIVIEAITE